MLIFALTLLPTPLPFLAPALGAFFDLFVFIDNKTLADLTSEKTSVCLAFCF
jgi:hypothetical protein